MSALLFWKVRKGRLHLGTKKTNSNGICPNGAPLVCLHICGVALAMGSRQQLEKRQPRYQRGPRISEWTDERRCVQAQHPEAGSSSDRGAR